MKYDKSKHKVKGYNMIIVNVYFKEKKYNYATQFNGTPKEAEEYFVEKEFNMGTVCDDLQTCIKIKTN